MFKGFFKLMSGMEKMAPETLYKSFINSSCPDDARILSIPENKKLFQEIQAEAFRQGGRGTAWDAAIDYSDFGFRPEEITYPVHVFQGDQDTYVPHELQRKNMDRLPNAVWHELPGRGHFFPMEMQAMIFKQARELMA
jgi:pimeloyl-ACP methyl ester carboxylesterase